MFRKQIMRLACSQVQIQRLPQISKIHLFAPQWRYQFSTERFDFKAETKKLLDIVAKSLYTDKDVFIRELLSNASDALEKQRFIASQNADSSSQDNLQIKLDLDEARRILTISDTGIGMTKAEMIENLGTIAHSGSRKFIQEAKDSNIGENIIGQFGVGFYSVFIVGDTVEVTSKSESDAQAYVWSSDGSGSFEITECNEIDFQRGTRIRVHLKPEHAEFVKRTDVEKTIQRYSNFIAFPILVNNDQLNLINAIWSRSKSNVSSEEYNKFYEYISNSKMSYRYKLHYQTDAPMSIKALLYVPSTHSEKFGMQMEQFDVSLYSKKVLIKKNCRELLPNYFRFIKGVVDCEDIPLNISRENYQDTALLAKLRSTITKRLIREIETESLKDPQTYLEWHNDFQYFLKEGIAQDSENAEGLMKLLRFQHNFDDKSISIEDYIKLVPKGQETIYFLLAPSRQHALQSPYMEPFKGTNIPVLFSFVHIDEMVFRNTGEFKGFKFVNIESQQNELSKVYKEVKHDTDKGLSTDEIAPFSLWLKNELQPQIQSVEISKRLTNTPAIVVSAISSGVRQVLSMVDKAQADLMNQNLTLEINPNHNLIIQLNKVRKTNIKLAALISKQLLDNCLMVSGLVNDPQSIVDRNIKLMEIVIQNAQETPQIETPQEARRQKKDKKEEVLEVVVDEEGKPSVQKQKD